MRYSAQEFQQRKRPSLSGIMSLSLLIAMSATLSTFSPAAASTTSGVALTANPEESDDAKTDANLEPDKIKYKAEHQEVEALLGDIETQWNSHNLDAVMNFYHDDYVNNDGLNKVAVKELTKDFWKTYPDAKSTSLTKNVRVEGRFATVESRDKATGSTAKEMPGIGSKGTLSSISEGQLYLRKLGKDWKIVGDRIDYEKVRVAFGLAQDLETSFVAPEQVKSGQEYSARLKVALPSDLVAVGSITSEPLQYPQPPHKDFWRPIDNQTLERIIHANTSNHNELLMATIGITDRSRQNLRGLTYLTRRLNVVPETKGTPTELKDVTQTAHEDEDASGSANKISPPSAGSTTDEAPKSKDKSGDKD